MTYEDSRVSNRCENEMIIMVLPAKRVTSLGEDEDAGNDIKCANQLGRRVCPEL